MGVMTALLGGLFGAGRNVVAETVEVFRPNAEGEATRDAQAQAAALAQFAAEFRAGGGWFDATVDGLNRLPRPMLAFGCIGMFGAALVDPVWFAARMQGLALVPEPMWALMGAIVAFYFGAREMAKARTTRMAAEGARLLAQAPEVAANIRRLETLREARAPENPALEAWRRVAEANTPAD